MTLCVNLTIEGLYRSINDSDSLSIPESLRDHDTVYDSGCIPNSVEVNDSDCVTTVVYETVSVHQRPVILCSLSDQKH